MILRLEHKSDIINELFTRLRKYEYVSPEFELHTQNGKVFDLKKYLVSIIFIIIIFLCASCESRKVSTSKQQTLNKTEQQIEDSKEQTTDAEKTSEINYNLSKLDFGFTFEPIDGHDSDFKFKINGQTVEGRSAGKIVVTSSKTNNSIISKSKELTRTIYKSHTTYKTHTTYKSFIKAKETDKKSYPLYWLLLVGAGIGIALTLFLQRFIPKILTKLS